MIGVDNYTSVDLTRKCTLWRCKSTPPPKAKLLPKFEIRHVLQATPSWGPISGLRARTAQDHVHTKFEECSFIRYRDINGVPKFRNWARTPGHAHLGADFWSAGKNSSGSMCTPNLKTVASYDTEILRGSRKFKIGHVPQATPTWGPISGLRARTAQDPRAHQI